MRESDLSRAIQVALSQEGARVFRNETGSYKAPNNQWIFYGLCVGSSDLIGWTAHGKFLAIEVKMKKKKPTEKQRLFIDVVNKSGGIGFVANSIESAVEQYRERTR